MIETHSTSMNRAFYARMGHEECEKVHLGSLEILERPGIDFHDQKAREILARGVQRWTAFVPVFQNIW